MPAPQVGTLRQAGVQPSEISALPSSHCSVPCTRPSPQLVRVQAPPVTGHCQPSSSFGPGLSTTQPALQPSPLLMLPSSHGSKPRRLPSPHAAARTGAARGRSSHPPGCRRRGSRRRRSCCRRRTARPRSPGRSPHTRWTAGLPGRRADEVGLDLAHWAVQPSPATVLPSSQTSPVGQRQRPSPQRSASTQVMPACGQLKPASTRQVAPQPSPAVTLPSSQNSPLAKLSDPSPQLVLDHRGARRPPTPSARGQEASARPACSRPCNRHRRPCCRRRRPRRR